MWCPCLEGLLCVCTGVAANATTASHSAVLPAKDKATEENAAPSTPGLIVRVAIIHALGLHNKPLCVPTTVEKWVLPDPKTEEELREAIAAVKGNKNLPR